MSGGCWFDNHESTVQAVLDASTRTIPRRNLQDWDYDNVTFTVEDKIAYVGLCDGRNANGITGKFTAALLDLCHYLLNHTEITVVVFTASGCAYFCTGGAFGNTDPAMAQFAAPLREGANKWEAGIEGNFDMALIMYMLSSIPQYKIAAIRGENMGAGNSLIACMDYVIAPTEKCKMHFMEVKRGVASCMTWISTLAKLGPRQMQRLTLVGEMVNMEDAKFMGLVQEIHGNNPQANERAIAYGKEVAQKTDAEIRAMKNSGPYAGFPLMKLPAAIRECAELQVQDPDFEVLTNEVVVDCGRLGRPAGLRLTQEMWPHKAVHFSKCGQMMMRITLDRKGSGNLINREMLDGLLDAAVELHKSLGQVRLVEIRARGSIFCAGLDKDLSEDDEQVQRMLFLFSMLPMPVLGIVEGDVCGFGVTFCSTFDLLAAQSQATFKFEGIQTEKCGVFASNRIGEKKVSGFVAEKAVVSAEQAYEVKLVTKVFQDENDCAEHVKLLCDKVSKTGPNGIAVQKFFTTRLGCSVLDVAAMKRGAGHVSTRSEDPEFQDSIKSIMDPSHKPRYAQPDLEVKPYGR